jgi:hypothetical protein
MHSHANPNPQPRKYQHCIAALQNTAGKGDELAGRASGEAARRTLY